MRHLVFFCLLLVLAYTSAAQDTPGFVGGQAIVRFTVEAYRDFTYESPQYPSVITSNEEITALFSQLGVYKIERLHPLEEYTELGETTGMNRSFVLHFPIESDVNDILQALQEHSSIEFAEPNHLFATSIIPNDTFYNNQWGLPMISMPDAWDIRKGAVDVRIAVLDVGFKLDHTDLSSKYSMAFKRDETDINVSGWQGQGYVLVSGEDYTVPDDDPTGTGTHGTHVAGIAGAATNNSTGVAGVGWNTIIAPVRCGFQIIYPPVGNVGRLETDDWIRALDWVRNNNAARVVNMSFGTSMPAGLA